MPRRPAKASMIDMALFDSQISVLANQNLNYLVSGKAPTRMGNAHPNIAPYEVLPVADGHIILAVGNDGQFRKFCAVIGLRRSRHPSRLRHQCRPRRQSRHIARGHDGEARGLQSAAAARPTRAAGVPASPINTIGEMFADPQTVARGMRLALEDGHGTTLPSVRAPMLLSQTALTYGRPSPRLGEHTAEILAELETRKA